MVIIHIAGVQERCNAMLQRHQWGSNRKQLVTGHRTETYINTLLKPCQSNWRRYMIKLEKGRNLLALTQNFHMVPCLLCIHIHSPYSDWQTPQWVLKCLIIYRTLFNFCPSFKDLFTSLVKVIHFYYYFCVVCVLLLFAWGLLPLSIREEVSFSGGLFTIYLE